MSDMEEILSGLDEFEQDNGRVAWDILQAIKHAELFTTHGRGFRQLTCAKSHPVWGKHSGTLWREINADGGMVLELIDSVEPLPLDQLRTQIAPKDEDLRTRIDQHQKEKARLVNEIQQYQERLDDIAQDLAPDISEDAARTNMLVQEQVNLTTSPQISTAAVDDNLQGTGKNVGEVRDEKDYKEDLEELTGLYGGNERENEPAQTAILAALTGSGDDSDLDELANLGVDQLKSMLPRASDETWQRVSGDVGRNAAQRGETTDQMMETLKSYAAFEDHDWKAGWDAAVDAYYDELERLKNTPQQPDKKRRKKAAVDEALSTQWTEFIRDLTATKADTAINIDLSNEQGPIDDTNIDKRIELTETLGRAIQAAYDQTNVSSNDAHQVDSGQLNEFARRAKELQAQLQAYRTANVVAS